MCQERSLHSCWITLPFLMLWDHAQALPPEMCSPQVLRGQMEKQTSRFAQKKPKGYVPIIFPCAAPGQTDKLLQTQQKCCPVGSFPSAYQGLRKKYLKMFCLIMIYKQVYFFYWHSQNYWGISWKNRTCYKSLFLIIKEKYTTSEIHPTFLKKYKPVHFLWVFLRFICEHWDVFASSIFIKRGLLFCAYFSES